MTVTIFSIKGWKPWIPLYLTVGWVNKSLESCPLDPGCEQRLDKRSLRNRQFIHHVIGVDWAISHAALTEEVLRQFLYKVGNNPVVSQFSNRSHVKLDPSNVYERGWKKTKSIVLRIKDMSNNAWGVRRATKETLLIIS